MCLVCLLLCKEEGISPVSAIRERRGMGMYAAPLSMIVFFGFWDKDCVSQLPNVLYYVVVKSKF